MNEIKSKTFYKNAGNPEVLKAVPRESKYILDIGCGAGDNARALYESGKIVDCITISEKEANYVKSFCRNVFICDLENGLPPLNQKYDVFLCSHIIEHIAYPQKLLADVLKLMKENSVLILALPNFLDYKTRLKLLFGKFNYEQSGNFDYTHLRFYTFKTGRELLEKNNFKINESSVQGFLPFNTMLRYLPESIKEAIIKTLLFFSKGLFGSQLIYIAGKK